MVAWLVLISLACNAGSSQECNSWRGSAFESVFAFAIEDILDNVRESASQIASNEWAVTQLVLDDRGLLVETTLPEGNVVTQAYTKRRLLASRTRVHEEASRSATRRWTYDSIRNVETESFAESLSPNGDKVLYRYDGFGRLERTVSPTGSETLQEYDRRGAVVAIKRRGTIGGPSPIDNLTTGNAALAETRFVKDELLRTTEVHEKFAAGAEITKSEYDSLNRPTVVTEPDGGQTTSVFDGLSRVVSVTRPLGNVARFEYDDNGNPLCQSTWDTHPFEISVAGGEEPLPDEDHEPPTDRPHRGERGRAPKPGGRREA